MTWGYSIQSNIAVSKHSPLEIKNGMNMYVWAKVNRNQKPAYLMLRPGGSTTSRYS